MGFFIGLGIGLVAGAIVGYLYGKRVIAAAKAIEAGASAAAQAVKTGPLP